MHETCDILLESSWQGLQLCFRPHCNWRSAQKVMCPQSCGNPKCGDPRCGNFGSPETKSHLDVALVEWCKVYYKGEGGGFPQVWVVVSLVCPSCLWFILTPKVLQLCTNYFVLVLCRFVWVNEACHFFLIPSQNSSMPLYHFIVLQAKDRPSIVFSLGFTFEPFKELGVHHL